MYLCPSLCVCSKLRPAAAAGSTGALAAHLPTRARHRAHSGLPGAGKTRRKRLLLRAATHTRHIQVITSEREARSEFLLIYTKNLSMSGPPARRPAGRGHAFERLISLEP